MKQHIFLIGFMGAGKTTLGKKLADLLQVEFIDSDEAIEKQAGKSISTIFQEEGEGHFRSLEKRWVEELNLSGAIIALGGGTPCVQEILDEIQNKGRCIYLEYPVAELTERLLYGTTKRPIIEKLEKNKNELEIFISELLKERTHFYEQATYRFSGGLENESIRVLVDQLRKDPLLF